MILLILVLGQYQSHKTALALLRSPIVDGEEERRPSPADENVYQFPMTHWQFRARLEPNRQE